MSDLMGRRQDLGEPPLSAPPPHPSLGWLTPDWPVPPCVRALSTWRGGGVSVGSYSALNLGGHVGDDAVAVAQNRSALRAAARLPEEPSWLEQVHGTCTRDLDSNSEPRPADAAITRQPGRVCAILTADCLPVLLATESGDRVGAAHAGWRGLAAGVVESAVEALCGGVGAIEPAALLAWLGPAIGPRHFEVGAEVRAAFLREAEASRGDAAVEEAFVRNARGRYLADLHALARQRLQRAGVTRIYGSEDCTYSAEDRYFSHRRDGTTGRQATLIWLEPAPRR